MKKIKLIRGYSVGIPMEKPDFVLLFKKNVDEKDESFLGKITERFSSSENKYIGVVNHKGFKIRKRKRLIDFNKNTSIVEGVFRCKGNKLYMETEVRAFSLVKMVLFIFIASFFIYSVGFKLFKESNEPSYIICATLLIQAGLLLGIPYLIGISRVKRMQREMEDEIYNWIVNWIKKP